MVEMAFLNIYKAEGSSNGSCIFCQVNQSLLKMLISDDRDTGFAVSDNSIKQKDEITLDRILIRRLQTN